MTLHHQHLARFLVELREDRGWRQVDTVHAARQAGHELSDATVQRYERGVEFKQVKRARSTFLAFEAAYELLPGTIERVLRTGDPSSAPSPGADVVQAQTDGRIELPLPDGDDRYHLVGVINEGLPGLPMARLREIAVLVRAMHEDQHPDDL